MRTALLGAIPLTLLTSCGSAPDEVDIFQVENEVKTGLIEQTGDAGIKIDCPSQREWVVGESFGCIADDSKGNTVRVTIYMENDAGDITWSVD